MTSGPLLIFGTSVSGKTTLANNIAERIGWEVRCSDRMGRHPGRPWAEVPGSVIEFYNCLSNDAIHWFLRVHHENIWPIIREHIEASLLKGRQIIEGAALRPELLAQLNLASASIIGLTLSPGALHSRILRESDYDNRDAPIQRAIDRFAVRCLRENAQVSASAQRHGFAMRDVSEPSAADELAVDLIRQLA